MLKAVIFDMDGVIIDSEPMHARAAILVLNELNIDVSMRYVETLIGCTMHTICSRMIKDFNIKNRSVEELIQANNQMKKALLKKEGLTAIPYVTDLIKNLYDNGMKLIIASSSSCEEIENVMDTLNIRQYFKGYVSGSTIPNPKPAPDIFLEAANLLGVAASECIVIEDSYNGVTAAKAANMTCIGYYNPNSGKQDLKSADILVEGFDEIDFSFIHQVYQQSHGTEIHLSTDRTIIRELTLDDVPNMIQIYQHPEIKKYIDYDCASLEIEIEKHKAYIQNVYRFYGYGLWGVFDKSNNQLIGRCGIELKSIDGEQIFELGYLLDPTYHRKGYATEFVTEVINYCFQALNIDRITAFIDKNNSSSINLAYRTRMNQIGEHKTRYRDCYKFEISK